MDFVSQPAMSQDKRIAAARDTRIPAGLVSARVRRMAAAHMPYVPHHRVGEGTERAAREKLAKTGISFFSHNFIGGF